MLIDTHFHLDLMDNMQLMIRDLQTASIGVLAVGTTPMAFTHEKRFCSGVNTIKVGLGMHPQLIAERGQEIDLFLRLVDDTRFIGEVGLDFSSSHIASRSQQIICFRKIAKACAERGGKVLSIHAVKSTGVVIEELHAAGTLKNNLCIIHWFTGTAAERKKALEAGVWFSVNPKMLRTKGGQETIKAIPKDRLLLETDAPFALKSRSVAALQSELEKLVVGISTVREENLLERIMDNSNYVFLGK